MASWDQIDFGLPRSGAASEPVPSTRTPSRLKRRLLAAAVAENVDLITGRRSRPVQTRRRPRPLAWAALAFLALSTTWLVALAQGRRESSATPLALASSVPLAAAPLTEPAPAAAPATELPESVLPVRMAREVFPLPLRTIVVDPGHGGTDLGTALEGVHEKTLTLDIARRVRDTLAAEGFAVRLTRESDVRLSLRQRARLANDLGADLFLSIHVNWIADRRQSRGVETYFLGPTDDPYLTELASVENAESGYSRADVRALLDRIYGDLRGEESQAVAASVQQALLGSLRTVNPDLVDRGVKRAPFLVLVATEMPAILAEVSCLSNRKEAELLLSEDYRDRIARALVAGVKGYGDRVARVERRRSG